MLRTISIIMSLLLGLAISSQAAVTRFTVVLDDDTQIVVDNASGWSEAEVTGLVLAADRSTREDCVYVPPDIKGLFSAGDRIFVNQNYLAWFDYTPRVDFSHGGELAGVWTINPSTRLFKYYRQGPTCANWPANELIIGSAMPRGGDYWWDKYAPPSEHSIEVQKNDGSGTMYLQFHHSQLSANGQWTRSSDGVESQEGVHYAQKGRMADFVTFATDIFDGNDAQLSGQHIDAEVEYVCRPEDILTVFRFQPTVNITRKNLVAGFWFAYAQDMDGVGVCDVDPSGDSWPPEADSPDRPQYATSNVRVGQTGTNNQYDPPAIVPIELNPAPCTGANWDVATVAEPPQPGTYLRFGASPTLAPDKPRWQMLLLGGAPNTGSGTEADPFVPELWRLIIGNESANDGTIFGGAIANIVVHELKAGKWYELAMAIQTTPCSILLTPASVAYPATGGSSSVSVATDSGCAWTASSSVSWITLNGTTTGSGNGTVAYAVAQNTGAARTGTVNVNDRQVTITQAGASLVVDSRTFAGDFNGDGRSDVLLQHASGDVAIWLMNGFTIIGSAVIASPGASWRVVGAGDVSGDGRGDILLQNASTGDVAIWLVSELTITASAIVNQPGLVWHALTTGDVNADGRADIILQHDDGSVAVWLMNGLTVTGSGIVGQTATSWHVVTSGDLSGDGRADLILQDATGQVAAWLMNGLTITTGAVVASPESLWRAVAAGDLDGDGCADIVLQSTTTGEVAGWLMNGIFVSAGAVFSAPGVAWRVAALGEVNGDARADILLQNTGTKEVCRVADEWACCGGRSDHCRAGTRLARGRLLAYCAAHLHGRLVRNLSAASSSSDSR